MIFSTFKYEQVSNSIRLVNRLFSYRNQHSVCHSLMQPFESPNMSAWHFHSPVTRKYENCNDDIALNRLTNFFQVAHWRSENKVVWSEWQVYLIWLWVMSIHSMLDKMLMFVHSFLFICIQLCSRLGFIKSTSKINFERKTLSCVCRSSDIQKRQVNTCEIRVQRNNW